MASVELLKALRASSVVAAVPLALCAAVADAGAAAPAATVEFAIGNVQVVSVNGQARPASKGVTVGTGDTIDTRGGRAQLRFSDGAYVSLQPESKFRIDDYRYEGRQDGNERGFFSLLSGGMRTITGLVGRTNKRNYQVTTSVATIGIRGTEYKLAYTGSISGMVGEGAINVCTGAGCLPVNSGETFYVPNPQVIPQITNKQVNLPPQQPGDPAGGSFETSNSSTGGGSGTLVAGDTVNDNGVPAGVVLTGTDPNMILANNGDGLLVFDVSSVSFDANGVPLAVQGSPVTVSEYGNNGLLAWWREPAGTFSISGFAITGIPTPYADIQTLAQNRAVATYAAVGGTTPVGYQSLSASPGLVEGKLLGATLTANFAAASVNATVSVSIAGKQLDMAATGMSISSQAGGSTKFTGGTCALAGGGCSMAGFFAGPRASAAGLVYSGSIFDSRTQQSVSADGAVALGSKP